MRWNVNFLFVVTAVFGLFHVSCVKEPNYSQLEQDNIENYINSNPDIPFTKKESGLYYHEVTAGIGEAIRVHDTAKVIYTGRFLNGAVFDTNVGGDTLSFPVGEDKMIQGFDEGVTYMKEGGTAILLVPSELAYGPSGYLSIPGYTPLLFNVKLARIARGPGK